MHCWVSAQMPRRGCWRYWAWTRISRTWCHPPRTKVSNWTISTRTKRKTSARTSDCCISWPLLWLRNWSNLIKNRLRTGSWPEVIPSIGIEWSWLGWVTWNTVALMRSKTRKDAAVIETAWPISVRDKIRLVRLANNTRSSSLINVWRAVWGWTRREMKATATSSRFQRRGMPAGMPVLRKPSDISWRMRDCRLTILRSWRWRIIWNSKGNAPLLDTPRKWVALIFIGWGTSFFSFLFILKGKPVWLLPIETLPSRAEQNGNEGVFPVRKRRLKDECGDGWSEVARFLWN